MKKRFHRLTAVAMTIFIFCFSLPFAASVGSNLNGWNPLNSMWYASQLDKNRGYICFGYYAYSEVYCRYRM